MLTWELLMTEVLFFIEVVVAGLLAGTMYSLVALGFVLIYKASSTFNFAQGAMVFFAVLAFVGFMELGLSFPLAFVVTVLLMVFVGFCTERLVLNPLMNQSEDTLLMATIGLGFVLEGLAQAAWGVEVRRLDLGIGDFPIEWIIDVFGLFVSALDLTAGIVAAGLITALALLFKYTRMGLGLRAVADDPGAASSIGIPVKNIMFLVWSAAGVVALVAGMMWGARAGVQFALVDLALKALPVLIIGGFSSIPGAIIGGLIIGATEKVLEVLKETNCMKFVKKLKSENRSEPYCHATVYRPWGWYINIDGDDHSGSKVKRIGVYPGKRLSLQSHNQRSEHWVIVKGQAKVQVGQDFHILHPNQSIYIPIGVLHRMENIGSEMVEFIETQIGDYLGDDDIIRYEDDFGRK